VKRKPLVVLLEVALVVAVALGTAAFAASDKEVTLSVDGEAVTVRTYAADVAALLDEQDVRLGERDVVAPSLGTVLAHDQLVTVRHARPLDVVIDGEPVQVWTTETVVGDALQQLGVRVQSAELTVSRSDRIPREGLSMAVGLPDTVTVTYDDRRTTLVTTAATVRLALAEVGVELGPRDLVDRSLTRRIDGDLDVTVIRVETRQVRKAFAVRHGITRRADPTMYTGETKVVKPGRDGRAVAVYRVTLHDGAVMRRKEINREVVRQPVDTVVRYGTKARPAFAPVGSVASLNWGALAQCESGGNPRAVNSAGYYGLYQFALSTWASVGGTGNPIDASPSEQTYRAQVLYQRSGAGPWPVCGRLLFT
jgi:resuscitation-promoting factor RpfB